MTGRVSYSTVAKSFKMTAEHSTLLTAQAAHPRSGPSGCRRWGPSLVLLWWEKRGRREGVSRCLNRGNLTCCLPPLLYRDLLPVLLLCGWELWPIHIWQPLSPAEEESLFEQGAKAGVIL